MKARIKRKIQKRPYLYNVGQVLLKRTGMCLNGLKRISEKEVNHG